MTETDAELGPSAPSERMPAWIHKWTGDLELPEWVWRTGHVTTACAANLPPHVVWTKLLRFSGLPPKARHIAYCLAAYCGGKHKVIAKGLVRDNRVHCYPKADDLVRDSGWCDKAVRTALATLRDAGWVQVTRHGHAPSDYWLSIPACDICPCGCEDNLPTQPCECVDRDPSSDRCYKGCFRPANSVATIRSKAATRHQACH